MLFGQIALDLFLLWVLVSLATPALSETSTETTSKHPPSLSLDYKPPTGGNPPSPRRDGGRRPGLPAVDKPLTALVPEYDDALTISQHPTFWIYVPYSSEMQHTAEVILWDEDEDVVYETTFQLTGTPGIVSFRLPETAPQLAIENTYRCDFSFIGGDGIGSATVWSHVMRVALEDDLRIQIEKAATPRECIFIYAINGVWHEALTELAELRRNAPTDEELLADWEVLLSAPGISLDDIVSEPIV
ncbi:DUF928 domain-containing protein [Microseira wollei]|uniref:DUF928 domain-containing protein n=1 Tax=Microseira wollei TaxID=467598 RepID=UPI001CFD6ACD|nr:DUF928 domain-containing protein [Microseira wollei]